jgi:DNA repair photolyase
MKNEKVIDIPVFKPQIRGRGALENPTGRFEKLEAFETRDETFFDAEELEERQIETCVYNDKTKTIVATNDSPDIGMEVTVNPYRGCEHGCIYCYARPGHEYFGLSAGLDFETKIFAKPEAAALLKQELSKPSWIPKVLTLSGVTDCYQPIERKLKITRGCMEVLAAFRNPAVIITKNNLVTRDADIFADMAKNDLIAVNMSITTLDGKLARNMEPRASRPEMRLKAIEILAKAGVPVNVMIGPVLPGLTEHEIPAILESASNAGATRAGYTMLRLPYGVKDLFQTWLAEHYPDRAQKILNRVREMRGGKLNDPRFGVRMRGEGFHADQIAHIFKLSRKRFGLDKDWPELSTAHFRRNAFSSQFDLFQTA